MSWARADFASFRLTAKCLLTPFHDVQANSCSIRTGERGNTPRRKYPWGAPRSSPLGGCAGQVILQPILPKPDRQLGFAVNACVSIAAAVATTDLRQRFRLRDMHATDAARHHVVALGLMRSILRLLAGFEQAPEYQPEQ